MMENDPPSLPSALQPTIVQITKTETPQIGISIPSKPAKQSSSSPTTPQSTSALGNGVQHTFYKPRVTATAAARRSRTESLTNSLNNPPGAANYPPSSAPTSRPQSLARSRPPSASYNPSPVTPSASASLTHTNNILPPASFFHPKQPPLSQALPDTRPPPLNANNVYAPARVSTYSNGGGHTGNRPLSGISTGSSSGGGNANIPLISSTSSHAREHGLIMLPLSHINSRHSDGSTSGPDLSSYSDSSQRRRLSAHGHGTRVKPSREALLPIGEKEALAGSAKSTAYTAMRGSLEKIFRRSASSSEKERAETPTNKDQPRTVMDDHAQAASSLSVRLWRQPSVSEPATKPEPATTTEPATKPAQSPPPVPVTMPHGPVNEAPQPIAFEGVALDGQRFTYGPEHNWQQFPSRNTFFLNGRLLTGGDSPLAFLFSLSVALGIGGTWFGTTAVWWWKYESPAVAAVCAYMALLTLASMLATALRDPGILPRDLDIDPPYPSTPPTEGGSRVPLPRDIHVRSGA
jgi:palmitoyltransferase ZDHHC9/14/18